MTEKRPWFAPKRYGYGAGLPIAWQGWAVLAAFGLVVALGAWLSPAYPAAGFAIILGAAVSLVPVCAARTRGGWRWRWGREK